jgi:hypothetical protein
MRHTDANRSPNPEPQIRYTGHERRASQRIETPFPTTVRSVDVDAQPFEAHTVLDNFSGRGLYLRLAWQLPQSAKLFVLIKLSVVPNAYHYSACVALHGVALRIEPLPGGAFGIAIRLTHHRFIYTSHQGYS